MRRATRGAGSATMRLRHAKTLPSLSRQWKIFSFRTPTTVTGMSPTRITCPTGSPVGKNTLAAWAPRTHTADALAMSSDEKTRPRSIS